MLLKSCSKIFGTIFLASVTLSAWNPIVWLAETCDKTKLAQDYIEKKDPAYVMVRNQKQYDFLTELSKTANAKVEKAHKPTDKQRSIKTFQNKQARASYQHHMALVQYCLQSVTQKQSTPMPFQQCKDLFLDEPTGPDEFFQYDEKTIQQNPSIQLEDTSYGEKPVPLKTLMVDARKAHEALSKCSDTHFALKEAKNKTRTSFIKKTTQNSLAFRLMYEYPQSNLGLIILSSSSALLFGTAFGKIYTQWEKYTRIKKKEINKLSFTSYFKKNWNKQKGLFAAGLTTAGLATFYETLRFIYNNEWCLDKILGKEMSYYSFSN